MNERNGSDVDAGQNASVEELATENRTLRNRVEELADELSDLRSQFDEGVGTGAETAPDADAGPAAETDAKDTIQTDETPAVVTGGGKPCKVIGTLSNTSGIGVYGENTATSGENFGIEAVTQSTNSTAAAVRARAPNGARGVEVSAADQIGVRSKSTNSFGVSAFSDGNTGLVAGTGQGFSKAIKATNFANSNPSSTGYGVRATTATSGADSAAIWGKATSSTGAVHGVMGATDSGDGYGLYTPDNAKVGQSLETDSIVQLGTLFRLTLENSDRTGGLQIGESGTDEFGDTTGPVIVGGHYTNTVYAGALGVTISGGGNSGSGSHAVGDHYATVGGGENNTAGNPSTDGDPTTAKHATVGGGAGNEATGSQSTVGGGNLNSATAENSTASGGNQNEATDKGATVGGGKGNKARGTRATVGGGDGNTATASYATVGGGNSNDATTSYATVPGGQSNEASGTRSFAAGGKALATNDDSFVWNGSESFFDVESPASSTFSVQASNGIWFGTDYTPSIGSSRLIDTSTGAYLSDSGTWTDSCSVTVKEDFEATNGPDVLEKVESLDVRTWRYEDDETDARHMGPTAEEFYETFELGDDDKHIASLDTAGVALAAIQGLSEKLDGARAELAAKDHRIDELEDRLSALESQVE